MRLIGQAAPENYLVCPGLSLVPIAQDLEVLVAAAPAAVAALVAAAPAAVAALVAAAPAAVAALVAAAPAAVAALVAAAPVAVAALIAALLQGALHRFAELEHLAQTLC